MVVAQQVKHLQQRLVRLAFVVAAVADEQLEQPFQRRFVLLARKLLEENRDKVEMMTKALLDWETIDADQINDIMAGHEPRPPKAGVTLRKKPSDDGPTASPNVTAPA